jgi:hypothetical protein
MIEVEPTISHEDWGVISNYSINLPLHKYTDYQKEIFPSTIRKDKDTANFFKLFSSEELTLSSSHYSNNTNFSLMEEECQNVTTNSSCHNDPIEELILPMEMQFNQSHIVSITVYSILFIFSAIGKLLKTDNYCYKHVLRFSYIVLKT